MAVTNAWTDTTLTSASSSVSTCGAVVSVSQMRDTECMSPSTRGNVSIDCSTMTKTPTVNSVGIVLNTNRAIICPTFRLLFLLPHHSTMHLTDIVLDIH